MAGEEAKGVGIEKFDGTDFAYWRMQIEDYLYGKKLHLPLLGRKPDDMSNEDCNFLDRQVLRVIRLTLSRSVAHNVGKEKTTADLMKALSDMYEQPSANNKHLNEFNTIINQLASVGIEFDDEVRALIALAQLPKSWEAMRTTVSNSYGKTKMKYQDIRDHILSEEVRRRDTGEASTSSSALNLETRGRGASRSSNRGRSKSRRGRSKSRSGKQVQCWNCGKIGHFKNNCMEAKKKNEHDSVNATTEELRDVLLLSVDNQIESWVLDSGASFHTTAHREIMQNYVTGDFGKVYLADGEALEIEGMGDVPINLPNGSAWLLQKVRHVLKLMRNLISVGQLDADGHSVLFTGGTWKITKGAMVIARGTKTGTLYMTSSIRDTIAIADANANLWHQRLGHISEKGMKVLLSKGKLPKLESTDFDMCEGCIFEKQKKVSFLKNGRTPKSTKLELVHTDLWGPSPVASLGGSRYYVSFIDDSSRKVWVYFLKNKSDTFDTFKKWRAMVENETGLI
ncbi:hypothetical protein CIPAW_08G070400 [Carya illinoinensis]|uniref:CCHC-type domain-containing protein n=1 Tax=Carya illinoinensis TaxID=32201 RepID=A0A8T1PTC4_CARIL|nr:hypothetical protein CIPAW_08G070400 [Carya illinoinensis]